MPDKKDPVPLPPEVIAQVFDTNHYSAVGCRGYDGRDRVKIGGTVQHRPDPYLDLDD